MTAPFRATPEGIEARFSRPEADLLRQLPDILESVGEFEGDAAEKRLAIRAYPDDPEADAEFRRLAGGELNQARSLDRTVFASSLERIDERGVLDAGEAEAWVKVIGETRLVLAARLGIEESGWEDARPEGPSALALNFLGYLQDHLVGVLSEWL